MESSVLAYSRIEREKHWWLLVLCREDSNVCVHGTQLRVNNRRKKITKTMYVKTKQKYVLHSHKPSDFSDVLRMRSS